MREFFNGWRRKVGCVVLVMACGLTSAWVRSKHTQDAVCFRLANRGQVLYSASGSIYYWTVPFSQVTPTEWPQWHRSLPSNLAYDGRLQVYDYLKPIRAMAFPYWPLTIPLTLLSAYLILWKPRPKPKPAAGSVTDA